MAPSRVQEPHNVEAEIVFLGAILLEPQTISRAGQLVRPADFFVERHSLIYQTMLELDRLGLAIDLITLGDRLGSQLEEVGGLPYLTSFLTLTPTAQHLDYYAGLIRKYARLRRLIKGAGRIVRLANLAGDQPDEALALAEKNPAGPGQRETPGQRSPAVRAGPGLPGAGQGSARKRPGSLDRDSRPG